MATEPKASKAAPSAPVTFPVRVRTTIQPEVDLYVEAAEYRDLHVQGLLLPGHDGTSQEG